MDLNTAGFNLYWRITASEGGRKYFARWGDELVPIWEGVDYGFTPEQEKLGFISWVDVCAAYERSADVSNKPYFGLEVALNHQDDFSNTGPMVFLLNHSKNIRTFIDLALKYLVLQTNGIHLDYEEDVENKEVTGVLMLHPMSGPYRQCLEHLAGIIVVMARTFVQDFRLKRLSFQHRPPSDLSIYKQVFGDVPITFDAPRNTITADSKYLDADQSSLIMDAVRKSLNIYINRRIKRHPFANKTVSGSVSEVLPYLMGTREANIDAISDSLGVHPKKLQRLLKEEGTSFKNILDNVRKYQAIRLLEDSDMAIAKISQLLGYSAPESFNEACKRWFGISPRGYRKSKTQRGFTKI